MKAITKKFLIASVAVGVLTPLIVNAETVNVQPEGSSNNEVEFNEDNYTINGKTTEINDEDTYEGLSGGSSTSEDSTNNKVTINGGNIEHVKGNRDSYGRAVMGKAVCLDD